MSLLTNNPGYRRRMLYERDGFNCHICGLPVKNRVGKSERNRNPLSSSIDHVSALSHGGRNTFSNMKIAHLMCNLRRGNAKITMAMRLSLRSEVAGEYVNQLMRSHVWDF